MLFEDYVKQVCSRLLNDQFNLETEVQINKYRVDLIGMSKVYGYPKDQLTGLNPFLGQADYRLIVAISFIPNVTIDIIKERSKSIYNFYYHKASDSSIFHRFIISVFSSNRFSDQVKSYINSYNGINFRFPIADNIHPVLVELDTDTIYHNIKVTMRFSRSKKIPIEAVEKYLILGNMKKV